MKPSSSLAPQDNGPTDNKEPGEAVTPETSVSTLESYIHCAQETNIHAVDTGYALSRSTPGEEDLPQEVDPMDDLHLPLMVLLECTLYVEAKRLCLSSNIPVSFQMLRSYYQFRAGQSQVKIAKQLYMESAEVCTTALQFQSSPGTIAQEEGGSEHWSILEACKDGLINVASRLERIAEEQEYRASSHMRRQLRGPWPPPRRVAPLGAED